MANYGKELRMGIDLRRKVKIEKAMAALTKVQEEMKRQADRRRKKAEE